MRSINVLVLVLALSGCGTEGGSGDDAGGKPVTLQNDESTTPNPAEHALLVEDASQLPLCDAEHEGLLVYVKADKGFQVCGAGAWEVIELKGDKGADGANGADGKDGIDSSSTVWLDPVTSSRWMESVSSTWANAQNACGGSFRLPTCEELLDAANHGLHNGIDAHTSAWCGEDTPNVWANIVTVDTNPTQGSETKSNTTGVYCVEDAAE